MRSYDSLVFMSFIYIITFLTIALLYSSIGFGGGSSYIAFMFLFNMPFEHIPVVALICNLIVVSGGAFYYIKNKQVSIKMILPFVLASIPASYLAGTLHVPQNTFRLLLGICLFLAAFRMIFKFKDFSSTKSFHGPNLFLCSIVGLILGFISGLVGIGGGIFLSPIMYNLKWGAPKKIAAMCSLFILFNSFFGLLGQLQKESSAIVLEKYWPLFIAVFVGGQVGSYLSSEKLEPRYIQVLTSILVLCVSIRILFFS